MTLPPMRSHNSRRNSGVPGSGRSVAINAARHAASGRRAGQMCSVEMCPWRTFFSCTESSDACFSGNATSMRRRSVMVISRRQRSDSLAPDFQSPDQNVLEPFGETLHCLIGKFFVVHLEDLGSQSRDPRNLSVAGVCLFATEEAR